MFRSMHVLLAVLVLASCSGPEASGDPGAPDEEVVLAGDADAGDADFGAGAPDAEGDAQDATAGDTEPGDTAPGDTAPVDVPPDTGTAYPPDYSQMPEGQPVPYAAIERLCVFESACSSLDLGDCMNSVGNRLAEESVLGLEGPETLRFRAGCAAAATDCDWFVRCTSLGHTVADCSSGTRCDGDTVLLCTDTPWGTEVGAIDCGARGMTCAQKYDGWNGVTRTFCTTGAACSGDAHSCVDGQLASCTVGNQALRPCGKDQVCGASEFVSGGGVTCLETGAACGSIWDSSCDGSVRLRCRPGVDGLRNERVDCAAVEGMTCQPGAGGDVACGPVAAECDPATTQDTCTGSELKGCWMGKVRTLDCTQFGFSYCGFRQPDGIARCQDEADGTGTLDVSWTLGGRTCPAGALVSVRLAFNPLALPVEGPCSAASLALAGVPAGEQVVDMILRDPAQPDQTATGSAAASVLAGGTTKVSVPLSCAFCPGGGNCFNTWSEATPWDTSWDCIDGGLYCQAPEGSTTGTCAEGDGCDYRAQTGCPGAETCVPAGVLFLDNGGATLCTASGAGARHDPCTTHGDCGKGLLCRPSETTDGARWCEKLCDPSLVDPCAGLTDAGGAPATCHDILIDLDARPLPAAFTTLPAGACGAKACGTCAQVLAAPAWSAGLTGADFCGGDPANAYNELNRCMCFGPCRASCGSGSDACSGAALSEDCRACATTTCQGAWSMCLSN